MCGYAAAKEAVFALPSSMVKVLGCQGQLSWLQFLTQAAGGRYPDNPTCPEFLQRKDVGAIVHLTGQKLVADAMPGQKEHRLSPKLALHDVRGRSTEGRGELMLFLDLQAVQLIQARATNNCEHTLTPNPVVNMRPDLWAQHTQPSTFPAMPEAESAYPMYNAVLILRESEHGRTTISPRPRF